MNDLIEHTRLPIMEIAHRPERFFIAKNDEAKELIALVDEAERLFPDERHWIRHSWASHYQTNGTGFKQVVKHLLKPKTRSNEQCAHIEKMQKFIRKTWP